VLYAVVRRTVGGTQLRYIERLHSRIFTAQEDAFFVDSGLTYRGTPVTTLSGLGHLEGKTVNILADGAVEPPKIVTSGQITLQLAGSVVQVGLPSPATLTTMNFEGGNPTGTAQGKTKRVHQVVVRVLNSLNGKAGPSQGKVKALQGRSPSDLMGSAPAPFSGDIQMDWPGDYDRKQTVLIVKDTPMPTTVLAVFPAGQTNTR
jgi:hypothetical protein